MRDLIKKVTHTRYKYAVVAIVIAIIVFSIGVVAITSLASIVDDKQVSYTEFTVVDKYISEREDHRYIIVSDNNKSFDIFNDDVGVDIFNRLQPGKHYHFVTKEDDAGGLTHIIQVYNETR